MLPGNVSPIADIGTNRDALLSALGGLQSMGDTPLYQAVDTFAAQQAQSWSSDRITAIVLLSDGENDTPNGPTIGAEQMLADLQAMHHDTPVPIFTLAYGADADVATLQSISGATGAHYYDATDPTKLNAVLGDLVTELLIRPDRLSSARCVTPTAGARERPTHPNCDTVDSRVALPAGQRLRRSPQP